MPPKDHEEEILESAAISLINMGIINDTHLEKMRNKVQIRKVFRSLQEHMEALAASMAAFDFEIED